MAGQAALKQMQGKRRAWFCGAHLGHGFHEDGLVSAMAVAEALGAPAPWTPEEHPRPRPAGSAWSRWRRSDAMIQLMEAKIFHERMRPRPNRFGYGALYCLVPLEELSARRRGPVGAEPLRPVQHP